VSLGNRLVTSSILVVRIFLLTHTTTHAQTSTTAFVHVHTAAHLVLLLCTVQTDIEKSINKNNITGDHSSSHSSSHIHCHHTTSMHTIRYISSTQLSANTTHTTHMRCQDETSTLQSLNRTNHAITQANAKTW
jgi:hypothetical protein